MIVYRLPLCAGRGITGAAEAKVRSCLQEADPRRWLRQHAQGFTGGRAGGGALQSDPKVLPPSVSPG